MPYIRKKDIEVSLLQKMFSYNPETGELIRVWSHRYGVIKNSKPLKSADVWVIDRHISKGQVIWAVHYGKWSLFLIDHRDRDTANNKINNLREATDEENQYNRVNPNSNGYKGITFNNQERHHKKPWLARIKYNGKRITLGHFATKQEAGEAYKTAAIKYYGEFANTGVV